MRYDCTVHSVNDSLGLCFEAVYVVNLIFRRVRPWDIFVQEACKTVDLWQNKHRRPDCQHSSLNTNTGYLSFRHFVIRPLRGRPAREASP